MRSVCVMRILVCTCVFRVYGNVSKSFVTMVVSCVTVLVIGDALKDASESLRMALLQRDKAYSQQTP